MPQLKGFQIDLALNDINNASILNPAARQIIRYNTGVWKNEVLDRIEDADNDTYIDISGTQGGDTDIISMAIGVSGLGAGVGSPFGAGSHTMFSASESGIVITGTNNNELGTPSAGGGINISAGAGTGAGIDGGGVSISGNTSELAQGGGVQISAGAGQTFGGSVSMTAGNSIGLVNAGGSAVIYSGNGSVGGRVQVYAGTGSAGNGGQIDIRGGGATATGVTGGIVNITAGSAAGVAEYGGNVNITGGQSSNGIGGSVNINGGVGVPGNGEVSGSVSIKAGNGDEGGAMNLYAGNANTNYSGGLAGDLNIGAGYSSHGDAGGVNISGGNATYSGGGNVAGDVTIKSGAGQFDNDAGNIILTAGSSATGTYAGDIFIQPGASAAADGVIRIVPASSATTAPELRFYKENPAGNYIGFKAPTLTVDQTYTLPLVDGTNGQLLATDGTGVLSFNSITASNVINVPTGSPGIGATNVQSALDELNTEKAPIASPAFIGTPTAPTQTASDNSTKLATTSYVDSAVSGGGGIGICTVQRETSVFPIPDLVNTKIEFNGETIDTDGMHSNTVNPTRITIPAGATRARASAQVSYLASGGGTFKSSGIYLNGVTVVGSFSSTINGDANGKHPPHVSAWIPVVAGDYFEIWVFQDSGANADVYHAVGASYFSVEYF